SGGSEANPEEYNRASFVAISLAVVGRRAEALLPQGAELRNKCAVPVGVVRLQRRVDLAMHWALSAGLTSIFGARAAENLGDWKELDDSLPQGSGFSFIDLAANRSGVQTALLALARPTAAATKEQLSRATDDYMLPKALLEAPEGLSDASFVQRFGNLEQRRYREAVSRIDRTLSQQRPRLPN
ncbi:MAG: YfiM family protein, partial [Pseudomonadota bacterium]|nr:YfiM family protein [Pseudomonadota bacterium]